MLDFAVLVQVKIRETALKNLMKQGFIVMAFRLGRPWQGKIFGLPFVCYMQKSS